MDRTTEPVGPPSRLLLALELRGIWELQAFFAAYPLLRLAPRGDGHPVLVLPGLAASDASTRPLRAYLTEQGYAAHGWKQGRTMVHARASKPASMHGSRNCPGATGVRSA